MTRRILTWLAVFGGLIAASLIAGGAYMALKAPLSTQPNSSLQPETCTPGPCATVNGYTIWISNVRVQNDIVRMSVKFQNSSVATHAAPEDLTLIDGSRRSSIPIADAVASCKTFTRHEFSGGAVFGPVDLCFRVTNPNPPFTLQWTPDLGAFCCEKEITIRPT
jgi:hypothetical protein